MGRKTERQISDEAAADALRYDRQYGPMPTHPAMGGFGNSNSSGGGYDSNSDYDPYDPSEDTENDEDESQGERY
jgi:hypothetical protein